MADPAEADHCEASLPHGLCPPQVRSSKLAQGVEFAAFRRRAMRQWIKRHGHIFEINVPIFGRSVIVSDPALVKTVCTASAEQLVNVQPNLSSLFGPDRCSHWTAVDIESGGAWSRRRSTVRTSEAARRSPRTRHCAKARVGPRVRSSGFSSR